MPKIKYMKYRNAANFSEKLKDVEVHKVLRFFQRIG